MSESNEFKGSSGTDDRRGIIKQILRQYLLAQAFTCVESTNTSEVSTSPFFMHCISMFWNISSDSIVIPMMKRLLKKVSRT